MAKKSAVVEPVKVKEDAKSRAAKKVVSKDAKSQVAVEPQAATATGWKFIPVKKTYEGAVRITYNRGRGDQFLAMVHEVKAGATLCGLSTQEPSRGMTHYGLSWSVTDKPVVCRRCKAKMDS
jgi:hypothetical protein